MIDNSFGNGNVWIRVDRDETGAATGAYVDYALNWRFDGQQSVSNLHIHRGAAGVGGRVVIPAGFMGPQMTNPQGVGRYNVQVVVTDPEVLAVVEEVLANPEGFYVNVHSTANRRGHIRGQLRALAADRVTALQAENAELRASITELKTTLTEAKAAIAAALADQTTLTARIAMRLGLVP